MVIPRLRWPRSESLLSSGWDCRSFQAASSDFDQFSPKMQPRICAVLRQLEQTLLHGDANLAAGAARAVAVDQLQQLCFLLMCQGKFAFEAMQSFADQRHVGLEVDRLDDVIQIKKSQIPCVKISGINELR